ncbi:MAG TPA: hypothetical protein EYG03_08710 [Planctomycetes bacterium]|nr:hypothetical protein [Fuerstiella sp.]HIK92047.1 hypothetical protein [Planctomycetota bacterium]
MSDAVSQSLTKLRFRRNSDAALKKAASAGDVNAFHSAFLKGHAKIRKRFEKVFGNAPFVAVWSAGTFSADVDRELCHGMRTFGQSTELIDQLVTIAAEPSPLSASFVLVAGETLLRCPDGFSSEQLATVFVRLAQISTTEFYPSSETDAADGTEVVPTVANIVTQAEVPFLLSLVLASQQSARQWQIVSTKAVADCLGASTDTDGTLDAALAREAGQWLAPFVRILGWAKSFKQSWANEKTTARWLKTLDRLAVLATPDGIFRSDAANGRPDRTDVPSDLTLLATAVKLTKTAADTGLGSFVAALAKGAKRKPKKADKKQWHANLSGQSDWATTAVLRNTMQIDADVMAIDWDQSIPGMQLSALGSQVIGGGWKHRITADGKVCESAGDWVCTCWFSDKEVAFAELEAGSADGVRHVRHVMLALKEHFAVLTDTVTTPHADAQIELETRLSLADGIDVETNSITRELILQGECVSLRAVPTWLDDDRIQNAAGSFEQDGSELVLKAHSTGGVAMPLVIDWHPDRRAADADWNRLTVTEDRHVATSQQAAGYRVRIGLLQLLLYRSLRRGEMLRAVLGYHTDNETVYSRIKNTGEILPLVLVESDA